MKESKKVRLLLLIVFFLSAMCSACMGFVAYQLATGELPFDIEKHYKFRDDPPKEKEDIEMISADVPLKDNKIDEETVRKEYKLFYEQRMKLEAKETALAEREELLEANLELTKTLDTHVHERLSIIKKERVDIEQGNRDAQAKLDKTMLDIQKEKQVQDKNIMLTIAKTLSTMESSTAMVLVSDLDSQLAAKLLNVMPAGSRSDILAQMIEAIKIPGYPDPLPASTKTQLRKKANEIIGELRKLKEDLKADPIKKVAPPETTNGVKP
jgi:hypothetical protein